MSISKKKGSPKFKKKIKKELKNTLDEFKDFKNKLNSILTISNIVDKIVNKGMSEEDLKNEIEKLDRSGKEMVQHMLAKKMRGKNNEK